MKSKDKKCKYKGYTYNGQVCTRKTDNSKVIVITCMEGLKKVF